MKKFFMLSLMVLAMIFFVSCSNKSDRDEISGKDGNQNSGGADTGDSANDDDTGADTGDSANDDDTDSDTGDSGNDGDTDSGSDTDPEFVADENIFEVPAGQDNTEGASCDPKTFVEFCDGDAYVFCSEEEIYNEEGTEEDRYFVEKYECDEDAPVCLTYRRNDEGWEHNWAACFSRCETLGKDSECTAEEDGFYFWYYEYTCKQTSKGKLLFYGEDRPCNSACSEDGKTCEMEKCDPETDVPACDENGALHFCYEWCGYKAVEFCAADGAVCGSDEFLGEEAACIYPDDDDEWGED